MEKQTNELVNELIYTSDIKTYCDKNQQEFVSASLSEYLNKLLIQKDMTRKDIILASALQENYAHQVFSGVRHPSRNKLLAMAVGFRLEIDEVQDLLKKTAYAPLYVRVKRDAYILHCFKEHYNIDQTNLFLEQHGESQLSY